MQLSDCFHFMVQTGNGSTLTEGIKSTATTATVVNSPNGLLLQAFAQSQDYPDAALISAEILADDMGVNFGPQRRAGAVREAQELAAMSFNESLQNVHEYLQSTAHQKGWTQARVSIAAAQFCCGQFSLCVQGDYDILRYSDHQLKSLLDRYNTGYLGGEARRKAQIMHYGLDRGELLLIMQKQHLAALGGEFLETNLGRFGENLDIAVKQINIHARREHLNLKPPLILCAPLKVKSKKWFA